MKKHGREWEEINSFIPTENDWKKCVSSAGITIYKT